MRYMNLQNKESKSIREYELLQYGWKFTNMPQQDLEYDTYQLTKTGAAVSPAAMSYDDHNWQEVELPHDFTVWKELDPLGNNYNGYLQRENCWYRRFFRLQKEDREKRLLLHFDGMSGVGKIWINGCLMKVSYSSFLDNVIDISDVACYGNDLNLIAVELDHTQPQGWWYEGCGLYRPVWLEKTGPCYIAEDEIRITAEPKQGKKDIWKVHVSLKTGSVYDIATNHKVILKLQRPDGKPEAEKEILLSEQYLSEEFILNDPVLWDIYQGNCYTLRIELLKDKETVDVYEERFGCRICRFDAEKGFFLNGKNVEIRGMCFHEDEGNLGSAIDVSVYERRLRHLMEMGANAYRCSHNAPARELLELCDKYGIMVMDETRRFDSGEIGRAELIRLVKRDRNHPSVILWSIGNEEPWQGEQRGKRIALSMKRIIKELDDTRPVTMAMHTGLLEDAGAASVLDVIGVNYNHDKLAEIHAKYPDKPLLCSEILNLADQVTEAGNTWSGKQGAEETLDFIADHAYCCGSFGWAGADYRGEHRNLGFFTDACPLDCNGEPKDGFYEYARRWNPGLRKARPKETGGPAVRFHIYPEKETYPADGIGTITLWIEARDREGRLTLCSHLFKISCNELGTVLCTDNADPYCSRFPDKTEMCLYRGKGKAVLRAGNKSGKLKISVSGPELEGAECSVDLIETKYTGLTVTPEAAVPRNPYINDWFITHIYKDEPDIYEYTTDDHYIYWRKSLERANMTEDRLPFFYARGICGYVIYCMEPDMPFVMEGETGGIIFEEITGRCKILISMRNYENRILKQFYHEKAEYEAGRVEMKLPGIKEGDRLIIKLVIEGIHSRCGLTGPVRFT